VENSYGLLTILAGWLVEKWKLFCHWNLCPEMWKS